MPGPPAMWRTEPEVCEAAVAARRAAQATAALSYEAAEIVLRVLQPGETLDATPAQGRRGT